MPIDDFRPAGGRELGPLVRELEQYGGRLVFLAWNDDWTNMTVQLHLPEDAAAAEKCREACRAFGVVE